MVDGLVVEPYAKKKKSRCNRFTHCVASENNTRPPPPLWLPPHYVFTSDWNEDLNCSVLGKRMKQSIVLSRGVKNEYNE